MIVKVPEFSTDAEAEAFLDQDLSSLDFSQFKPVRFGPETEPSDRTTAQPEGGKLEQ
ncbi:CopG family antitoxin [Methylobacterium sp. Gmos1]